MACALFYRELVEWTRADAGNQPYPQSQYAPWRPQSGHATGLLGARQRQSVALHLFCVEGDVAVIATRMPNHGAPSSWDSPLLHPAKTSASAPETLLRHDKLQNEPSDSNS